MLYGSTLGGFDPYLSGKGSVTAAAEKGMFTEKMSSSSLFVFAFKMSFALKEVSKLCHNPCPKGRELRCTHHWPQQVSAAAKLVSSPGSFSFDCLFYLALEPCISKSMSHVSKWFAGFCPEQGNWETKTLKISCGGFSLVF